MILVSTSRFSGVNNLILKKTDSIRCHLIGFQDGDQAAVLRIELFSPNLTSKAIFNEINACRTLEG